MLGISIVLMIKKEINRRILLVSMLYMALACVAFVAFASIVPKTKALCEPPDNHFVSGNWIYTNGHTDSDPDPFTYTVNPNFSVTISGNIDIGVYRSYPSVSCPGCDDYYPLTETGDSPHLLDDGSLKLYINGVDTGANFAVQGWSGNECNPNNYYTYSLNYTTAADMADEMHVEVIGESYTVTAGPFDQDGGCLSGGCTPNIGNISQTLVDETYYFNNEPTATVNATCDQIAVTVADSDLDPGNLPSNFQFNVQVKQGTTQIIDPIVYNRNDGMSITIPNTHPDFPTYSDPNYSIVVWMRDFNEAGMLLGADQVAVQTWNRSSCTPPNEDPIVNVSATCDQVSVTFRDPDVANGGPYDVDVYLDSDAGAKFGEYDGTYTSVPQTKIINDTAPGFPTGTGNHTLIVWMEDRDVNGDLIDNTDSGWVEITPHYTWNRSSCSSTPPVCGDFTYATYSGNTITDRITDSDPTYDEDAIITYSGARGTSVTVECSDPDGTCTSPTYSANATSSGVLTIQIEDDDGNTTDCQTDIHFNRASTRNVSFDNTPGNCSVQIVDDDPDNFGPAYIKSYVNGVSSYADTPSNPKDWLRYWSDATNPTTTRTFNYSLDDASIYLNNMYVHGKFEDKTDDGINVFGANDGRSYTSGPYDMSVCGVVDNTPPDPALNAWCSPANKSYKSLTIDFDTSGDQAGTQYNLIRVNSPTYSNKWLLSWGVPPSTYTDDNLAPNTSYDYQIRKCYPDSGGDCTAPVVFTCSTTSLPDPTDPTCENKGSSSTVYVDWNQSTDEFRLEQILPSNSLLQNNADYSALVNPDYAIGGFPVNTTVRSRAYAQYQSNIVWGNGTESNWFTSNNYVQMECTTSSCVPGPNVASFNASPGSSTWSHDVYVDLEAFDTCGSPFSGGNIDYIVSHSGGAWDSNDFSAPYNNYHIDIDGEHTIELSYGGNNQTFGTYRVDRNEPDTTVSILNTTTSPSANEQTITIDTADLPVNGAFSGLDEIHVDSAIAGNFDFYWLETGFIGSGYTLVNCPHGRLYYYNGSNVSNISCDTSTTSDDNENVVLEISFDVDPIIQVNGSNQVCFDVDVSDQVNTDQNNNYCFNYGICDPSTYIVDYNPSNSLTYAACGLEIDVTHTNECGTLVDVPFDYEIDRFTVPWDSGTNIPNPGTLTIDASGTFTIGTTHSYISPLMLGSGSYKVDCTPPVIEDITVSEPIITVDSLSNSQNIAMTVREPRINGAFNAYSGLSEILIESDIAGNFNAIWDKTGLKVYGPAYTKYECNTGSLYIKNEAMDHIASTACTVNTISDNRFTLSVQFDVLDTISYDAQRRVNFNVSATDIVNNVSGTETDYFEINHKPYIDIDSPLDGEAYSAGDTVQFEGSLNPNGSSPDLDQDDDTVTYQWHASCTGTGDGILASDLPDDTTIVSQDVIVQNDTAYSECDYYIEATDEHGATARSQTNTATYLTAPFVQNFTYSPNLDITDEYFGSDGVYVFTMDYTHQGYAEGFNELDFTLNTHYNAEVADNEYLQLRYDVGTSTFKVLNDSRSWEDLCINSNCNSVFSYNSLGFEIVGAEAQSMGGDTMRVVYQVHFIKDVWNEDVQAFGRVSAIYDNGGSPMTVSGSIDEFDTPGIDTMSPELSSAQLSPAIEGSACDSDDYYIDSREQRGYTKSGGKIILSGVIHENGISEELRNFSVRMENDENIDEFYEFNYVVETAATTFSEGTPSNRINITTPVDINPVSRSGRDTTINLCITGVNDTVNNGYSILFNAEDMAGNGTTHSGNLLSL